MKFNKIFYLGLATLTMSMTACTTDDAKYTPADPSEAPEAYFSPMADTDVEIQETDTEFKVPVYRATKEGSLTVPVKCVCNSEDLFTIPQTVTFVDGSDVAEIVVTYVATNLEGAHDYTFTFYLGDTIDTPYAYEKVTYTAVYFPWVNLIGPNGETQGRWVDDMICTWYGSNFSGVYWPVTIQESPAIEGLYRVVNPYQYFASAAGAAGYDSSSPHYLYFNAKDPNGVFICDRTGSALNSDNSCVVFTSGMTIATDGQWQLTGTYNVFLSVGNPNKAAEFLGSLSNGVVKFPVKGIAIGETNYNGGIEGMLAGGSYVAGNANGLFRIMFPGAKEEEPEPTPETWESIGKGSYMDPIVMPVFYGETGLSWEVEIEKNTESEGVYRMVNPYKAGVMVVDNTDYGSPYEGDLYVEFDISDPTSMLMPYAKTGFVDQSEEDPWGSFEITNLAYDIIASGQMTMDQIVAAGYADPYDPSTRTITADNIRLYLPDVADDHQYHNKLLTAGAPGQIVLPAETATSSVAVTGMYVTKLNSALRKAGIKVNPKVKRAYIRKGAIRRQEAVASHVQL